MDRDHGGSDGWNPESLDEFIMSADTKIIGKNWYYQVSSENHCFFQHHKGNGYVFGTCWYHNAYDTDDDGASNKRIGYVLTSHYDEDGGYFYLTALYTKFNERTGTYATGNTRDTAKASDSDLVAKLIAHMQIPYNATYIRLYIDKCSSIGNGNAGYLGVADENAMHNLSSVVFYHDDGTPKNNDGEYLEEEANASQWQIYKNFLALQYDEDTDPEESNVSIRKNNSDGDSVDYTIIGPFSIKYGGKDIERIVVNGTSYIPGSATNKNYIFIYEGTSASSTASNYKSGASDFKTTTIKNGAYFYLAVPTSVLPDKDEYEIVIQQKEMTYGLSRVTVTIGTNQQEYGIYDTYDSDEFSIHKSVNWTITANRGKTLELSKYDINGSANQYTTSDEANGLTGALTGSQFIIYVRDSSFSSNSGSGWLSGTADGTKELKEKVSDATAYTLSSATLEIKKLEPGYYYIYEVGEPTSSAYYPLYAQKRYMKLSGSGTYEAAFKTNTKYTEWVYMGYVLIKSNSPSTITSNTSIRQIISVTTTGSTTQLKLGNYRAGILENTKVDADTDEQLREAKFMIYCDSTNGACDGWMSGTYNETKTYGVFDYSNDSQKYNRNTLTYLTYGTYYIYEIKAPAKNANNEDKNYDLRNQYGYMATGYCNAAETDLSNNGIEYVYCGSQTVSEKNTRTANKILNEITNVESGELTIEKLYDLTGEYLSGAEFIIYCDVNTPAGNTSDGWLNGGETATKTYTAYSSKTTYAVDQTLTLTKLLYGTYYVYEVTAPTDFLLEDQNNYMKTGVNATAEADLASDGIEYAYCGSVTISQTNKKLTLTIENELIVKLKIIKKDSVTDELIEGIGFKIYNNTNGEYLCWDTSGVGVGTDKYHTEEAVGQTTSEDDAGIFYTDANGEINITGIEVGSLQAVEDRSFTVSEADSVNLNYQADTAITEEITITDQANNLFEVTIENTKAYSLSLYKKDGDDLTLDLEAKFYIQYFVPSGEENSVLAENDGKWLAEDGTYSDTESSINVSTSGITISDIQRGTYAVYEYEAPTGYDLTQQYNYNSSTGYVECGTITVGDASSGTTEEICEIDGDTSTLESTVEDSGYKSVTMTIYNRQWINNLNGIVWVDNAPNKISEYNYLYDENEELVSGITVELHHIDGTQNDTIEATGITDENGRYDMTLYRQVLYWNLCEYYVSFEYNNETYVVVDPFATGSDSNINYDEINSKAQEYLMTQDELDDVNLLDGVDDGTNVQGNSNPGYAITNSEATSLTDEGCLANYYNDSNCTIENINLGLLLQEEPEYTVEETLAYAYVTINGFSYIYYYDEPTETITYDRYEDVPDVAKQQNAHDYNYADEVSVYSSDIASTSVGESDMKLYLVYSIYVSNLETMPMDDIYNEQKLFLTSLTNEHDLERLTLSNDHAGEDQYIGSDQFAMWEDKTAVGMRATAHYSLFDETETVANDNSVYKNGINAGQTIKTYIQFQVTSSSLKELINGDLSRNKSEATEVNATGFHEYLRTDNVWNESVSSTEYASDTLKYPRFEDANTTYSSVNSEGDTYYIHKTIEKSEKSGALYIALTFVTERTISGTVYEDIAEESTYNYNGTDYEVYVGNGKLDDAEINRAEGVKVELLEINTSSNVDLQSLTVATLYVQNEDGVGYTTYPAETTTEEDGEYSFVGVVPGYYYIRFTYGDGTQEIVDTSGNKIGYLTSNDYKSTVLNTTDVGSILLNALEATWRNENGEGAYDTAKTQSTEENSLQAYYSSGVTDDTSMKLLEWYKYLGTTAYNTATDDLNMKDLYNGYEYTEKGIYDATGTLIVEYVYDTSGNLIQKIDKVTGKTIYTYDVLTGVETYNYEEGNSYPINIQSYTPETAISIENTEYNYTNSGNSHANLYDKFNLGIVKQPETTTTVTKTIEDVSITVQTGEVVVKGLKSKYVSVLDSLKQNIGVEIENDTIYGSEFSVKYQIKIANESEVDYIEDSNTDEYGTYYKYGAITTTSQEKTIEINEVVDDIDSKYVTKDLIGTTITQTYASGSTSVKYDNSITIEELDTTTDTTVGDTSTVTTTSITFSGWKEISTGESLIVSYSVRAILNSDDDTLFENPARITSISLNQLTTLTSSYEWGKRSWAVISAYPATGGDMRNVLYIAGAIALVAAAFGVILIKKKII